MNHTILKRRPNGNIFPEGTPIDMGTKQRSPAINNPYTKNHSIPVTIKRWFTDVSGTIVNKSTVPAALQIAYPFFVFGEFDKKGGYSAGFRAIGLSANVKYLLSYVHGDGFMSQLIAGGFSGVNTIKDVIAIGDIVHVYADSDQTPTYFIWVVQHFSQGAIGSIVSNSDSRQRDGLINPIYLQSFKYHADNARQFEYPFFFIRFTNLSTFKADQVQPLIYKDPYIQQPELLDIQVNFNLDQYLSVGQLFQYDTDTITMNFKLLE